MPATEQLPQQRDGGDEYCDEGNPDQESANHEDKNESRDEADAEHQQDEAKRSDPCDIDAMRAALVEWNPHRIAVA